MKVLSLIEPWATLIKDKKKFIETRSFKTSYRGELYIHASATRINKDVLKRKELMDIVQDSTFSFGYIICKCKLVDCIYMTEEYIENIKNNNYQEYVCGEYKVGRYAWILEDITPLEQPIRARGQLNIWNYYTEVEVMNFMEDIQYGWCDKNKKIFVDDFNNFGDDYRLQSPKEVIKNKVGVCWDQVELERYYFRSNDINVKTYFLVHYDNDMCPTHTFLTYEKNNKFYWFEHSWKMFRGIHEYGSLKELLSDVRNKFIRYELNNEYLESNLVLHEYSKPKYNISVQEFYEHCDKGEYIEIK